MKQKQSTLGFGVMISYCTALSLLFGGPWIAPCGAELTPVPATHYWDGAHLARMREPEAQKSSRYKGILKRVKKSADRALKHGPYSVMDKREVAPSGDKHDYLSYARYWWPNPDTADGLPYIRKDGRTNEDLLSKGDRETIGMMYDDVEALSLAGYLFNEKKYGEHAATLLRAWFVDPATRMNPNLRYGQAIPGRNDGRNSGVIDTRHFIRVLDSVALMRQSDSWSDEDHAALTAWMKQYLDWLRNDPMGKEEAGEKNNHGTWCDAQVAAIAMFVGEREVARHIAEGAKANRIGQCIEPDGRLPEELERTNGLHYSVFHLSGMAVIARIGEQLDVDLWHYETKDGRSVRRGLDFIMPYLAGDKKWPYKQIKKMSVSPTDMGLFYLAATRYKDPQYLKALDDDRREPDEDDYALLLFPGR